MRYRTLASFAFVIGALATMLFVQSAGATHPRPKGATPIRLSLVPAYAQCTAPNRTHGPPLAFPSCNPPAQASSFLTVGTPDANGAPANSEGFVKIEVIVGTPGPPDDSDFAITFNLSDVRCKAGVSTCGNSNAVDGADYTGQLQANATIRMTDHYNAATPGGGTDTATVVDIPFPINNECASTADTSIGGLCQISTSAVALGLPSSSLEGKRVNIELAQMRISDGGPDGQVSTANNTPFAVQGLFIP